MATTRVHRRHPRICRPGRPPRRERGGRGVQPGRGPSPLLLKDHPMSGLAALLAGRNRSRASTSGTGPSTSPTCSTPWSTPTGSSPMSTAGTIEDKKEFLEAAVRRSHFPDRLRQELRRARGLPADVRPATGTAGPALGRLGPACPSRRAGVLGGAQRARRPGERRARRPVRGPAAGRGARRSPGLAEPATERPPRPPGRLSGRVGWRPRPGRGARRGRARRPATRSSAARACAERSRMTCSTCGVRPGGAR